MKLILITGTNGKTTTADFLYQLLTQTGIRAATIGTLGLRVDNAYHPLDNFNLDSHKISRLIEGLQQQGVEIIIMEAYSKSLALGIFEKLTIDIAIFTNFSNDHLDFHKSADSYFEAKAILFKEILPEQGIAIYNSSLPGLEHLIEISESRNHQMVYIGSRGTLKTTIVGGDLYETEIILECREDAQKYSVKVPFIGDFNIENLLTAITGTMQLGIPLEKLVPILPKLKLPAGRLEAIPYQSTTIFIDYAHTPEALAKVIGALQERLEENQKLHLLFGCGGNRDIDKRKDMGQIAATISGYIYITDDNPRNENPEAIRKQILQYCPNGIEVPNRKVAIKKAVKMLGKNDVLLLAGKGQEQYMDYNHMQIPHQDQLCIMNSIKNSNTNIINL